jgi:hypothetical protein
VDESENRNSEKGAITEPEGVSADTPSPRKAASGAQEQGPADGEPATGGRNEGKPFLVAMGEKAGRAARVLGRGSRGLFKGSAAVIVRTARGVGMGVGKLDARRRELAADGELRARCQGIRRQLDETHAAIGVETARGASADGSAVTVSDDLQKLLAREKSLRQELERAESAEKVAKKRAEADATASASATATAGSGAEVESAAGQAEEIATAEPRKRGRAKGPVREKGGEAPARAGEGAIAETASEVEVEGETNE